MQDARKQRRAEKDAKLEAKRCRCGAWFTVEGRRERVLCFRCEQDGQARDGEGVPGMPGGVRY